MNHSFNIDFAEKYGIEEAILLENIAFWIRKNEADNKNFNDGYTWTYNSVDSFNKLFPYMTPSKINRSLLKLEKLEVLKIGNYNKASYDRTRWYTISNVEISSFYKMKNGTCKMEDATLQNEKTIPYINSVINTNINISSEIEKIKEFWNSKEKLGKIRSITKVRKDKTKLRLQENGLEDFLTAIEKLNISDYALGNNKYDWIVSFDWLVENDNNIVKVLEGKYDSKVKEQNKNSFTKNINGYKIQSL